MSRASLVSWFKSNYPTLEFNSDWIEQCIAYLEGINPHMPANKLIKAVEEQLLASDLSTSVLHTDALLPEERSLDGTPQVLFKGKRRAVLVQVVAAMDIANPSLDLLQILQLRKDHDAFLQRKKSQPQSSANSLVQWESQIREESSGDLKYPSGMLRIRMHDGLNELDGFEYKTVPGLSLENLSLGTKLLLHDIRIRDNLLYLTPESVTVKGGVVPEFDAYSSLLLENALRANLDLPPLPAPETIDEPEEANDGGPEDDLIIIS